MEYLERDAALRCVWRREGAGRSASRPRSSPAAGRRVVLVAKAAPSGCGRGGEKERMSRARRSAAHPGGGGGERRRRAAAESGGGERRRRAAASCCPCCREVRVCRRCAVTIALRVPGSVVTRREAAREPSGERDPPSFPPRRAAAGRRFPLRSALPGRPDCVRRPGMAAARQVLCVWALLGVARVRCEPIRYSVAEEGESGSPVGDVAEDAGLAPAQLSARRARIASPAGRQHFRLERGSGRLVVAERLDREEMCGRSRTCTLAFELLLADPLQFFPIEVSVEDINDHSPVFPDERVTLKIPERGDPGSRFPVEAAQDLDIGSNDIQAYSIVPENEFFTVSYQNQSESEMHVDLVLQKPLDREEQPEMDFTLVATDGGSAPRSGTTQIHIIVLDVNDNSPIFTQKVFSGHVLENAPKGFVVLRVVANDADDGINGDITYEFSQPGGQTYSDFTVDPRSGEIRVTRSLDFETAQKYEFSLRAVDGGGLSAMCKVVVEVMDVNDNAPEIVVSSFSSPIPENAAPGTVVALFSVTDKDSGVNGEISCALAEQLSFSLRPAFRNYYELVTVSALDREQTARYTVVVTAADAGSPRLSSSHTFTVDIWDVNDNAPVFNQTSYTMYVHENNVPALLVGAVQARDADAGANGKVSYSLVAADPPEREPCSCVSVNSESGAVFVLRPLDYEQLRQLEVVVSAADAGSPPLSSSVVVRLLVVDENDNAPLVLHPSAQDGGRAWSEPVPAWAEAGDLVSKVVAVDADSGQNSWLSYGLLRATEPGLFAVGAQSGEVRLRRPPTERDAAKQQLVVLVRDNGRPPLSATAALSVLLLHGSRDAELPQQSPAAHDDDGSLTASLIVALVLVSLLFLVSAAAFAACKACKSKEPSSGHVLYGPSGVQSCVADGAAAGTLPHAYCYELSLSTGSGNSEFQFLKPVLPSLPAQRCSPGVAGDDAEHFPAVPVPVGDADVESPGMQSVGQFHGF